MIKRSLFALLMAATLLVCAAHPVSASTSTFYVESVIPGDSVTLRTLNFPPNTLFTAYVGAYGTHGAGGYAIKSFSSGDGGVLVVTVAIPPELANREKLDVRLESADGYIFYKSFTNCTSLSGCGGGATTTTEKTTVKAPPQMTIYFIGVTATDSVKVSTANFPADTDFISRIGKFGTKGIGGIEASRFNSGDSGIFTVRIPIPIEYAYTEKLDLRIESVDGKYAASISFSNTSGGKALSASTSTYPGSTSGSGGPSAAAYYIPTVSITSVDPNKSVTLQTHNFPASQTFTVRMGAYGTYGINGVVVGTTDSGTGGSFPVTYQIPETLKGSEAIAIRLDSPQGYYAFNWFVNQTGGGGSAPVATAAPSGSTGSSPTATPVPPATSFYSGYPYFYVTAVVQNSTVTINGYNFPPNQSFVVTMGAYGTYGVGGVSVGTTDSGSGGVLTATYNIPASLAGSDRIAIRLESPYYYAYNWFYNNTAP